MPVNLPARATTLGVAALGTLAVLGCTGITEPVDVRSPDCRCTLQRPWSWYDLDLLDEPHLGIGNEVADRYVTARFLPRSDRDHSTSAIVLLDSMLADDIELPVDLGDTLVVDGRLAATRRFEMGADPRVDVQAVMVPYPDGHVWMFGWTLPGDEEGMAEVEAVIGSLSRAEPTWELPAGVQLQPPVPADIVAARQGLTGGVPTDSGPPTDDVHLAEVTVATDVGDLPAWWTELPAQPPAQRRPAVLYLPGGFDTYGASAVEDLGAFEARDIVVMLPHLRGQAGVGPHELFGGEIDDAAEALRMLRSRPDVDPDRVYVLGYAEGSLRTLLLVASTEGVRAAVTLEGPTDLSLLRALYPKLYGTGAYPADPEQDDLRSATRFAGQLKAPVWALHGEFDDDAVHGALMAAATHRAGSDRYRWHLVPRGDAGWAYHALEPLAEAIVADTGPRADLGIDAEWVQQVAEVAWNDRWPDLQAHATEVGEALWHGHVVSTPDALTQRVVDERGAVDGRPPLEVARRIARTPRRPPTELQRQLALATEQLDEQGIVLRLGVEAAAIEALLGADERYRGFGYAPLDHLLRPGDDPVVWLRYGDARDDATPEHTTAVGRQIVTALERAGATVRWSGDPSDAIGAVGALWSPAPPADPPPEP
jgi:dienelactone hydrolase